MAARRVKHDCLRVIAPFIFVAAACVLLIGVVVQLVRDLVAREPYAIRELKTFIVSAGLGLMAGLILYLFGPKVSAPEDAFGPAGGMSGAEQKALISWE